MPGIASREALQGSNILLSSNRKLASCLCSSRKRGEKRKDEIRKRQIFLSVHKGQHGKRGGEKGNIYLKGRGHAFLLAAPAVC